MATIYLYKIFCETEQVVKYVWGEVPPTECPTNTSHTVQLASVAVVDERGDNKVNAVIVEESIPTGGHYQARGFHVDAATSGWHHIDLEWPIPISLLSAEWNIEAKHKGDNLEVLVGPDTTIGVLTSPCSSGSNTIEVSATVLQYTAVGRILDITDGSNLDNLGMVVSISGSTITTENETTHSFSAGTTVVRQTVQLVRDACTGSPGPCGLGESKIGGSYIPPSTKLRLRYKNNDGVSKALCGYIEYLY